MVPRILRRPLSKARLWALSRGEARHCPLCGWTGSRFLAHGIPGLTHRFDARCPKCGSLERHRLARLVFDDLALGDDLVTLHVAPEASIGPWLRSRSRDYLSIDLSNAAMRRMDLTDLQLADASQSLVWCSNVLEHIPDDRKAMHEMFRVLRPGGTAFLQVPLWNAGATYEDPSITSPEERLKHFYQKDHVRLYGMDIVDRLRSAGFEVAVRRAQDFGSAAISRCGLSYVCTNEVFVCTRPVTAPTRAVDGVQTELKARSSNPAHAPSSIA